MTEQPALDPQTSPDNVEMINSLRQQGADQIDPVRFHFLEALAQRAQTQTPTVRRVVDDRLAAALADYRQRVEQANVQAVEAARHAEEAPSTPLADLLSHIALQASQGTDDDSAEKAGHQDELKSLRQFRDDWSKLSVNQTVSQALAAGPTNAGPLNSHALVLQALRQTRDTAPDYLGRFMAYADTLFWLDQANSNNAPAKMSTASSKARSKAAKKRKPE